MAFPFRYPAEPHERRHGPQGYADYGSYRPWLRDEFTFRCVYCLFREQWTRLRGAFNLDHFQPVCLRFDLAAVYDNLLYACAACNLAKGGRQIPDPCRAFLAPDVEVREDGTIVATAPDARRLIRVLGLDDTETTEFRMLWLGIIRLAEQYDPSLYQQLMGFPLDLPDLAALRPPEGNTRAEGVESSWFRQRERGSLPLTY